MVIRMVTDSQQKHKETGPLVPRVILVVTADAVFRGAVSVFLRREGYVVFSVGDTQFALEFAKENDLSLIVIDLHEQLEAGMSFCQHIKERQEHAHIPLLALVRYELDIASIERQGLRLDDYLLIPFSWEELSACTQTLLRCEKRRSKFRPGKEQARAQRLTRSGKTEPAVLQDVSIDLASRVVTYQNRAIEINSVILFDLLLYLTGHQGVVVTREALLENVWRYDTKSIEEGRGRTVDVHIHKLRELLGDDPTEPYLIQTIRGVGYRFKSQEQNERC